jgi:hypothetical protein
MKFPLGETICRITGASAFVDTCPITEIVSPAAYASFSVEMELASISEKPVSLKNGINNNAENAISQILRNFIIVRYLDYI